MPTSPEQQAIARKLLTINDPMVYKNYQNDPRVALANSLIDTGTSTAPVASGGWGITEGIARALSGGLGGFLSDKKRKEYAAGSAVASERINEASAEKIAEAVGAKTANAVQGVQQPDPLAAVSGRMQQPAMPAPAEAPMGVINPNTVAQGPAPGAPAANPAVGVANALTPRPGPTPVQGVSLPASVADQSMAVANPTPAPVPTMVRGAGRAKASNDNQGNQYFFTKGIIPIEGGTDAAGNFRTSPKGAIGPAQVMPGTAREAARLAGLPYNERKYRTDAAYNTALGQAYYNAKVKEFGGDAIKGAAAYNAGAGRVRRAIRRANSQGGTYVDYLPEETQKYVKNFIERVQPGAMAGGSTPQEAQAPQGGSDMSQFQVPVNALPAPPPEVAAPKLGDRVRSARLGIAHNLLNQDPNGLSPDFIRGLVDQYATPEAWQEDTEAKMQRDRDETDIAKTGYTYNLMDRNTQRSNLQQASIEERKLQIQHNLGLTEKQADQVIAQEDREDRQTHERNTAAALAETQKDIQRLENQGIKVPVSMQNKFFDNAASLSGITNITDMVNKYPNEVGALFMAPEQITQRTHPHGVEMRAMLANWGTQKLHDRAGATVTVEEFARQRGWYPSSGDNAEAIKAKMNAVARGIREEQAILTQMYPGAAQFQGFNAGAAPAALSGTTGQAPAAAQPAQVNYDDWTVR